MRSSPLHDVIAFALFTLIITCSGCNLNRSHSGFDSCFPGNVWAYSTPQAEGIDRFSLQAALDTIDNYCHDDRLDEMLIIRHGKIVYEGDSVDHSYHNIWSASKTLTSTVLGLLIDEGKCRIEDPAALYEPTLSALYPEAQLHHFASMTSGYSAQGISRWDGENTDWSWTPYHPDTPHFAPGTAYAYWDEAQMMYGKVLTRIAKDNLHHYLDQKVMKHIGVNYWEWLAEGKTDTIDIVNGCTNVVISPKDLARFALLLLNEGNWDGQQLISSQWVKAMQAPQVPATLPVGDTDRDNILGPGSYGYNVWLNGAAHNGLTSMPDSPRSLYYLSGFNHNVCFIIPEWDMIVIRMGQDGNPEEGKHVVWNKFFKEISAGISTTR